MTMLQFTLLSLFYLHCGVVGVKGLFSFTPQVKNDRSDYFSFATIFHNPHDTHTPYGCLPILPLPRI